MSRRCGGWASPCTASWARHPSARRTRADRLGVARAYASLEELLDDPAVEVVHVTSPNHLHHPQVKAILARGTSRRVREAAGGDVGAVRRAGRARRGERPHLRGQLQHPLLPPQPASPRRDRRGRAGGHPPRDRSLLPGLAVPGHGLELAARPGGGRRPARLRRHRHPLGGPGQLHHGLDGDLGARGARHRDPGAPRTHGTRRDVLHRARHGYASPRR